MRAYVITGPASCGKSTLVSHLSERGFFVVNEIARQVLLDGVFHPNEDPYLFQQEIARRQIIAERKMREVLPEVAFLDRGFYDQIGYCERTGVKELPREIRLDAHYDGAFVLDMLPDFEADGVRVEADKEEVLRINEIIVREYERRNIPIIRVPVMPVHERAEFVISRVLV